MPSLVSSIIPANSASFAFFTGIAVGGFGAVMAIAGKQALFSGPKSGAVGRRRFSYKLDAEMVMRSTL
jgi:hypothetical protein